jgi:hypothetical protein
MFNTYMKYTAMLIGLYLLVSNVSGTGVLFSQGAAGLSQIDKTLQGR